MNYFRKEH